MTTEYLLTFENTAITRGIDTRHVAIDSIPLPESSSKSRQIGDISTCREEGTPSTAQQWRRQNGVSPRAMESYSFTSVSYVITTELCFFQSIIIWIDASNIANLFSTPSHERKGIYSKAILYAPVLKTRPDTSVSSFYLCNVAFHWTQQQWKY